MVNVVVEFLGIGIIGVVVLDKKGRLVAGIFIGGKGFEKIGWVSDLVMFVGNYVIGSVVVSCIGIGEDIIDECLAVKIVIWVMDGFFIKVVFECLFVEVYEYKRDLGVIGIDVSGIINWGKICDVILVVFYDGYKIGDSLDVDKGILIFVV